MADIEPLPERPWIPLHTTYDVEAWIDSYNYDLRRAIDKLNPVGQGICFLLVHGGEIYLHTDSEGTILLDVTSEAEWVAPVITAATGVPAPLGQVWQLPGHLLTQLVMGLNSLIGATRIVTAHDYRLRKRW
ncbi:hypothetical protein E4K72_18900 [Oxalobacteraceae bacterium OM1]|nr:hypothetical protein E4K72_18900 [Oxalobacteraceae bacterium OM1]